MENFIVSARKYRPSTFDTVVGQSSITNTLKNAIKSNHLAQAFLFCGPRGVGKTTCARILAKTINCSNRTENIEACNECESCKSFNNGSSLNVYELDAASNNSVDDIRSLVDQVRVPPQLGDYKVYIIDEVHMLSTSAFNAFLKTLEEPPKYAIFILATTEKHKIIPTILSRCQIFDFNRIQIDDIAKHLTEIAKKESIEASEDALHVIAQKADGALRDALSIFDQIVSFAGSNITYEAVIENLNILDHDYYFKITDHVLSGDISSSLMLYNEIINKGFDGHNFVAGLASHFRSLLVSKDQKTLELLEVGKNIKERYKQQAEVASVPFLLKAISIANKTELQYKTSKNQRLQVELGLMQLCSLLHPQKLKTEAATSQVSQTEAQKKTPVINEEKPVAITKPSSVTSPASPAPASTRSLVKKKGLLKTATTSINSIKKDVKEEAKEEVAAEKEIKNESTFTQDELENAWNKYATSIKESNPYFHASFTAHMPVLKEDFLLEWEIENKSLLERFEKEAKMDLLEFLRTELNNDHLQVKVLLNVEKGSKKVYTAQDKFNKMLEKNPNLQKLKQQFDLDIDY